MFVYVFDRGTWARQALARLSLAKKGVYEFDIGFYMFSTEELRLATGTPSPVARKQKVLYMLYMFYMFSTEELRLATGASACRSQTKCF